MLVPFFFYCAAVLDLYAGAPLLPLAQEHIYPLQDVEGLEPGDDAGEAELFGNQEIRRPPDDHTHVPRQDEAVYLDPPPREQGPDGRGDDPLGGEEIEIGKAFSLCLLDCRSDCRGGGLEPHGEEANSPFGMILRHLKGVQR